MHSFLAQFRIEKVITMKAIFSSIFRFFAGRVMYILRILIAIFMIMMGIWFAIAPIVQQFSVKDEALRNYPYLMLIVPVGLLQIGIGISLIQSTKLRKHNA